MARSSHPSPFRSRSKYLDPGPDIVNIENIMMELYVVLYFISINYFHITFMLFVILFSVTTKAYVFLFEDLAGFRLGIYYSIEKNHGNP